MAGTDAETADETTDQTDPGAESPESPAAPEAESTAAPMGEIDLHEGGESDPAPAYDDAPSKSASELDPSISTAALAAGYTDDDARELVSKLGADGAKKHLDRFTAQFGSLLSAGAGGSPQAGGNTPAAPNAPGAPAPAQPKLSDLAALTPAEIKAAGDAYGDPAAYEAIVKPLNDKLAAVVDILKGLDLEGMRDTVGTVKQRNAMDYQKHVDSIFDKFSERGWGKVLGDSKKPNYDTRRKVHDAAANLRTMILSKGGRMEPDQAVAAILNAQHSGEIEKPEATRQATSDLEARIERRSRGISIPPRQNGSGGSRTNRPASANEVKSKKVGAIRDYFNAKQQA